MLVVTNMYPSGPRPALGRFVRDQVEALRELDGLEVELFAFSPGGARTYANAARSLRRRYRGKRFHAVHAHYGLTGWCALSLLHSSPVLVTFHGTDLHHRAVGPLSRALAELVSLPATVSAQLARSGGLATPRRDGSPATRGDRALAVLPMGVDLERFRPLDRNEVRRQLGLRPQGRYVLFPADPARPEKRHDRARRLADAAGATLLAYRNTHPEEAPLWVNAANAVLVTSEREGFGLGTLEALACEVPVLATPVGVAPLALSDLPGALCEPFELPRWAGAIAPHLEHPDPRLDGRARAALFDRRRMAERVFAAYRELAAAASG